MRDSTWVTRYTEQWQRNGAYMPLKFLALKETIFYDRCHHNQKERTVSSFLSLLLPEDSFSYENPLI